MSLYNALHGVNPLAGPLLQALGIDQKDEKYPSGRFRDIYLNEDGTEIMLLTRNGGGNRDEYQDTIDKLATHPLYLRDYDDDYDCTYAYIIFSVPEEIKGGCKILAERIGKPMTLKEKSDKIIMEMDNMNPEDMKKDERFSPLVKVIDEIMKDEPGTWPKVVQI